MHTAKIFIWVLGALLAIWIFSFLINQYLFLYYDIQDNFRGVVAMRDTDINDRCGEEWKNNSTRYVHYKFDEDDEIVYLCPITWWPIQQTVAAETVTPAFLKTLRPDRLQKIIAAYPPESTPPLSATAP